MDIIYKIQFLPISKRLKNKKRDYQSENIPWWKVGKILNLWDEKVIAGIAML